MLGLSDPDGCGWVHRLARIERDHGHFLVPYVQAVEEETTASLSSHWQDEARNRLSGLPASALLFCFGLHDQAADQGDLQVSLQDSLHFAEAIITEAIAWRTVFWLGPPPLACGTRGQHRNGRTLLYDQVRVHALSQAFAGIAQRVGVPFLDLSTALHASSRYMRAVRDGRGVAPNSDGHDMLAEAVSVWKPWREWLDQGISPNFCRLAEHRL